jgi:hypothetical protein
MESASPTLIKIGEMFVNLSLVTHVTFEGHGATVYLACQVTDVDGKNGAQQVLTFDGTEAHELMQHLRQRTSVEPA